eukprot:s1011_g9.t1
MDSKLSIALQNIVDNAGETAYEMKVLIRQRSQALGKKGSFIMGRKIFAMILDHFRTTSRDEVFFNASHIYRLQYRGDKEMDKFLNAWLEIIANMKPEDIPSDVTLRDHVLRKIEGSTALHVDLVIFKGRENNDEKKTYKALLEIMKRHIARVHEDRNMAARSRDKCATDYTNLGKPTTPAPKATATPAPDAKDDKTGKPGNPAPKAKPGTPVLPSGNPKAHAKGKGKGNGKGKSRSRSASTKDKSKMFCHFHFNKGGCKQGGKCPCSHSQYHWDRRKDKDGKKGSGKSNSPRRSNTPKGKKDDHCYGWVKGACSRGDTCKFRHDPNMKGKKAASSTMPDAKATQALVREFDDDDVFVRAVPSESKKNKSVKFNDNVDVVDYKKKDYVPCSWKIKSKKGTKKKTMTTEEILSDPQWIPQNRQGASRSRAIGILMDCSGEFADVDEVHIVLGPTSDIKMKTHHIEDLWDDSSLPVCYEEVIPHVQGKFGRKDNIMCIKVLIELRDRRFIMDSGSGHDLISAAKVDRMDLYTYDSTRVNFHTANGITSTTTMMDLDFDTFTEPSKAHVLEDTPSVLLLGKRCMEQGYSFAWPSGREPYMINSEGKNLNGGLLGDKPNRTRFEADLGVEASDDEVGVELGPDEEEKDEDDIDIGDPEGGVRLSKRGTLKHEARTLEHLLTHRYKNPYCNSCVTAKMKHFRTFRGAFKRKLTKFGDLITFDFMDTRKTTKLGYDTVKEILVVRDRYTGIIQSYPSPTKTTDDVIRAIKFFEE